MLTSYPDEGAWWPTVEADQARLYGQAGLPFPDSPAAFRWSARTAYDIGAGMEKEAAWAKHRAELCLALGLAATPPPVTGEPRDELDLSQATWLHRNVSAWPITSRITQVTISPDTVCVHHTKAGQFPVSRFGSIEVEGNVWIFATINGRWYGATWDWLRPGQTCKAMTAEELGRDQIRIAPMDASWTPRTGDPIGFLVSSRARDDVPAGQERTNVVRVTWPYG